MTTKDDWYKTTESNSQKSSAFSEITGDTIQLLTSDIGILPGFIGNLAVRLALPAIERVIAGVSGKSSSNHDLRTSDTILAMAKAAAQEGEIERGVELLEQAASMGNTEALLNLGCIIKDEDPERAVQLLSMAAQNGSDEAKLELAYLIRKSDPTHAEQLFEQLHHKKNDWGTVGLADMYIARGATDDALSVLVSAIARFNFKRNKNKTALARMAAQVGLLYESTDQKSALKFYKISAKGGDTYGMRKLAALVRSSDPKFAREILSEAAVKGDPQAMSDLAKDLEATDVFSAIELYIRAIEKHSYSACSRLAGLCGLSKDKISDCLRTAKYVWNPSNSKDNEEGTCFILKNICSLSNYKTSIQRPRYRVPLYEYCSKRGDYDATIRLAKLYDKGAVSPDVTLTVLRDSARASTYYKLALDQGAPVHTLAADCAQILDATDPARAAEFRETVVMHYGFLAKALADYYRTSDPNRAQRYDALSRLSAIPKMSREEFEKQYPKYSDLYDTYRPYEELTKQEKLVLAAKVKRLFVA